MPIDRTLLQDIATRGRAALDDYRQRQSMNGSAAQQALQSRSQTFNAMSGQAPPQQPTTGRGPIYDQLIFARNAQRFPAPGARGGTEPREASRLRTPAGDSTRRRQSRSAQRAERVVRDFTGPHEIPQRAQHDRFVGGAGGLDEVGPEARAGLE